MVPGIFFVISIILLGIKLHTVADHIGVAGFFSGSECYTTAAQHRQGTADALPPHFYNFHLRRSLLLAWAYARHSVVIHFSLCPRHAIPPTYYHD
jgi:hypothetical protein